VGYLVEWRRDIFSVGIVGIEQGGLHFGDTGRMEQDRLQCGVRVE